MALHSDRRLGFFNHTVHLATGALLAYVQIPIWSTLLVAAAIVVSHRACARRHVARTHPRAIVSVVLESDASWTLYRRDGQVLRDMRMVSCWLSSYCILAHFKSPKRRGCSVIVTRRAIGPDSFRRLRIFLLQ